MISLGLQFFAHKKGMGSTKNGRDSESKRLGVKRGLRNPDGTGVLAGLTNVCDVVGYEMVDGVRVPAEGKLIYRGIDVQQIVDAAQRHGVHFCPCYSTRSQPLAREVGSVLQRGAIGDLYSFQCTWITSDVLARGPDNWLFHKQHSAGGILAWLGCHWLDLLRFLMRSEVVEVTAMCATQTPAAVDVEDVANVCLRFDNGAVGMLRAGYLLRASGGYDNSDMQFQFEGSQGALTWYPRAQPAGYRLRTRNTDFVPSGWQRDIVVEPAPQSARAGYSADFLAEFLAAVEGRGPLPASEVDAWQVLRVIEAAYRSSAEGRKVTL